MMQETDANSELDTNPRFVTEVNKMECDEITDPANCDSPLHEQHSENPVGIEPPVIMLEPPVDLLEIIDRHDIIAENDKLEKLGVQPTTATSASIPRFVTEFDKMECDESIDPANCDTSLQEQRSEDPVGIEPPEDLLEIIDHDDTIAQDDKQEELGVKPYKFNISGPASATSAGITEHVRTHTGKKQFHCGECDYVSAQRGALTAHIRKHTGERPFKCSVCEYSAAHVGSLRQHLIRQHQIKKIHKCVDCDYACAKSSTLRKHKKTHTRAKLAKRTVCDIAAVASEHLQIPNKTHIKPKPFYICPVCEYSCTKESILHTHMKSHTKVKLFQCSKCDYSCARRSDLTRHMRGHTGIRPFHCIVCDYTCTRRFNLQLHMNTHSEETLFKCRLCDYFTTALEDLEIHTRTHNEQTPFMSEDSGTKWASMLASMQPQMHTRTYVKHFKCKFCAYISTSRGCLKRHMRVHSTEKPFKCTICDYASQYRSSLIRHIRTHSGEKSFKCDVCDYAATRKANLEVHMLTHAGETIYKCKLCDYVSSFRNSLIWHEVSHTVAQPFLCNICNYATTQHAKLTKHIRMHTGERPFKCSLCSYAGLEKYYLTRHMKTHSIETSSKQIILSKPITNVAGESRPSASNVTSAEDLQITTAVKEDCNPAQNILKTCKFILTSIRNNQGNINYIIVDQHANQVQREVSMDEMRQTMNQSDGMRDELPKDKEVAEKCTEVSQIRNVTEDDIRDIHDTNVVDSRNDVKVDITKVKVEVTPDEIAPTMNQSDGLRYEIMKAKEEIKKCKERLILEIRQKMDAFAAVAALRKKLEQREKLWMEEKRKLEDRINKLENQKLEK